MKLRRPIMAALVAASSLLALAVPAGANTASPTQWNHGSYHCYKGSKSATWVQAIQVRDPSVPSYTVRAWFDNPCRGQWLSFGYCPLSPPGVTCQVPHWLYVPPGTHGHLTNLDGEIDSPQMSGRSSGFYCGDYPSDYGPNNDGFTQRWTRHGPRPEPTCKTAVYVEPPSESGSM
jgi:hypothetical protein